MARNPGPGRCVHCLNHTDSRNWDHVFPESWYPDTTPANLAKWQVPSCIPCNDAHGKREKDLLIRLALCLDPDSPQSAGVIDRALRAIDPSCGKNASDSSARQAKRNQLIRHVLEGPAVPASATYPGFKERWGRPIEAQAAITISEESLRLLTIKIVRGIHFIKNDALIEPPYNVEFYVLNENQKISRALEVNGERFARGPGIEVVRLLVPEDNTSSFWRVSIFGQLITYASVSRVDG